MDDAKRAERIERLRRSTTCPIENCGRGIPRTLLMCRDHWFEVPPPLRREVNASARRDGYQAWLDEALAAIEAVEEG